MSLDRLVFSVPCSLDACVCDESIIILIGGPRHGSAYTIALGSPMWLASCCKAVVYCAQMTSFSHVAVLKGMSDRQWHM